VFGLAEALAHLERALRLWDAVPDASDHAGAELAELLAHAAELASDTGDAPRAVELIEQAIALGGHHTASLHARLSRFLFESGSAERSLAAIERALELVPPEPPSVERAQVLASYAGALRLVWRHEEAVAAAERALEVARAVGAHATELRALSALGSALAYLGDAAHGLETLRQALELATERGGPRELYLAYVDLTDALTMLGRPAEAARLAAQGLEVLRPFETDHTVLTSNWIEALVATGAWDEAEPASAAAVRAITANYPHMPLMNRADLELGRGALAAARAHLEARTHDGPSRSGRSDLRGLRRRAGPVGAPVGRRRPRRARGDDRGGRTMGRADPRLALRPRAAGARGARRARPRTAR
jgi:tetratricopeptide (TPR) repeat protein